jgi:hypothetical protein
LQRLSGFGQGRGLVMNRDVLLGGDGFEWRSHKMILFGLTLFTEFVGIHSLGSATLLAFSTGNLCCANGVWGTVSEVLHVENETIPLRNAIFEA